MLELGSGLVLGVWIRVSDRVSVTFRFRIELGLGLRIGLGLGFRIRVCGLWFFKMKFTGVPCLMTLCKFQVYNSIIHHLYVTLGACHPKSSLLPSPYI